MYTQGQGRRVHLVLLVPSIEIAEKINAYLDSKEEETTMEDQF
jgi:PHP family Zn ribbon phosphoesterase